jgi:hypothetical protein
LRELSGGFFEGPVEGVLKRVVLAVEHGLEVDDFVDEEVFELGGEAGHVESGVVGAEGDGDAGIFAAVEDGFEFVVAFEGAGFEVAGGADFEALVAFGEVFEEVGMEEGDLDAVPDAVEVGEEFFVAVGGGFVEVAGGFETLVAGAVEERDEVLEAFAVGPVRAGEVDGDDIEAARGEGEAQGGGIDLVRCDGVHAEDLSEDEGVLPAGLLGGVVDGLDDELHVADAIKLGFAGVGAFVGGVAEFNVGEVLEEVGAADELEDEVGDRGDVLNGLDELVHAEVAVEVAAGSAEVVFEVLVVVEAFEEGVLGALEVDVEDAGGDGAAEVEVEFGVESAVG